MKAIFFYDWPSSFSVCFTRHLTVTFLYSYSHQKHLRHLPIAFFFALLGEQENNWRMSRCWSIRESLGHERRATSGWQHQELKCEATKSRSQHDWYIKLGRNTVYSLFNDAISDSGTRGRAVRWGIALQTRRSRVRFNGIFYWHNPFGRTVALRSTQPLTEMSTRSISWW